MTEREQTEAFCDDLDKLVARYEREFDLSRATAVGCLQFKAFAIMHDGFDEYHEEESEK